jgi:ppGpp synthetase/RelA/SpoT-type nucleotidyltranferase
MYQHGAQIECLENMAWTTPQYNRGRVDVAGQRLIADVSLISLADNPFTDYYEALEVINNWRSSHGYPLQCLKMTLLTRAKRIDSRALIAQRLKRLSSIAIKLKRHEHMKLSQMHDLGGCRAVLRNVSAVHRLASLYQQSMVKNPNVRMEFYKDYDYIQKPKSDGYRSIHLVYKYRTKSTKNAVYNGLRIEIQLRSRLQHAWATAVETVSTFTGQALKSNIGSDSWKRFFALMGSAIALRENCPLVPGTPTDKNELIHELRSLAKDLKIKTVLQGWRVAINMINPKLTDAHAFLLTLDTKNETIAVKGFPKRQLVAASEEYLRVEKENANKPEIQTVLVALESVATLRSAYPNYYADTKSFLNAVRKAIQ